MQRGEDMARETSLKFWRWVSDGKLKDDEVEHSQSNASHNMFGKTSKHSKEGYILEAQV